MTEVNWSFKSTADYFGGTDGELPQDVEGYTFFGPTLGQYINNLDYWRVVAANRYVVRMGFRVKQEYGDSRFSLANDGADHLDIGTNDYQYQYYGLPPSYHLTGTQTYGWYDVAQHPFFHPYDSFQSNPALFHFHTDGSATNRGFTFDRARVCCGGPLFGDFTHVPLLLRRAGGVLLGAHDVVYFAAGALADGGTNFALRGSSGADFDLYVRCNAQPTPTQYDHRSNAIGSHEFIHVPRYYCYGGTMYIAVNSASGSGSFDLVRSGILNRQIRELKAGTEFNADATTLQTYAAALYDGMRFFYGATEGQSWIRRITVYNSGAQRPCDCDGVACDVCLLNDTTSGHFNSAVRRIETGVLSLGQLWTRGTTYAHEWGHMYWNAHDDYYLQQQPFFQAQMQCGHSIMSGFYDHFQNNFCYSGDHNTDRWPTDVAVPPSSYGSGWQNVNLPTIWPFYHDEYPRALTIPEETPDNYDYLDHTSPDLATVVFN